MQLGSLQIGSNVRGRRLATAARSCGSWPAQTSLQRLLHGALQITLRSFVPLQTTGTKQSRAATPDRLAQAPA